MILIVEDESVSRRALQQLLRLHGYEAEALGSAEEALRFVRSGHVPALALVDLNLPGMDGAEFVGRLNDECPGVLWVFMSGNDREYLIDLRSRRDDSFLRKPIDFSKLLGTIGRAMASQSHAHDARA